ncbi:HyaD/HybD family hydrogenase maturation endopeptidase [Roseibium sediminis]|uniref:HyaD/HybD family hydrogenase maturation endopeptidase n=1 Tax=Roseibium sediminis TaxID=1775174 RepID=UPI00123DF8B5|nr:HyaD/HybD family hydrogenase maturation endopeptidase [Roseibium sediminis]
MGGEAPTALVLGIGNLLWADEGFGVRAVEELHRRYRFDDNVLVMDGGTQGVYLVQHIRDADILVVFDAVDYGLPPGTLKLVQGDEVPKFLGAKKISLHQTGFQEVLAMAEMLGDYPRHLLLIGVQPVELDDYGGSLRPAVKAQIEPSIRHALQFLADHGIQATERDGELSEDDTIASLEMTLGRYEGGRPDAASAYRHGDDRVVSASGWSGPSDFEAEMEALVKHPAERG